MEQGWTAQWAKNEMDEDVDVESVFVGNLPPSAASEDALRQR